MNIPWSIRILALSAVLALSPKVSGATEVTVHDCHNILTSWEYKPQKDLDKFLQCMDDAKSLWIAYDNEIPAWASSLEWKKLYREICDKSRQNNLMEITPKEAREQKLKFSLRLIDWEKYYVSWNNKCN